MKGHTWSRKITSDRYAPYVFLSPTIILFIAIFLFPIIFVIGSSFTNWNLLRPDAGINFIGFKNFSDLLTDPNIWGSIGNTAVFTLVSVPLSIILGLLLAIIMDKLTRGKKLVETLLLIPMMIAPIAIFLSFRFMFEPTYGIVNKLLALMGVEGPGWFSSVDTAMFTVILVELWRTVPFVYIVLYAALQTLPSDPFEAAKVDGAGPFQTFKSITIPLIKPTLLVITIVRVMDAIRAFDIIYVLTRGGPANATKTIQYICYEMAFSGFAVGKGSALAIIIVVIILLCGFFLIRAMNKAKQEQL